jgi:hypothetical protein
LSAQRCRRDHGSVGTEEPVQLGNATGLLSLDLVFEQALFAAALSPPALRGELHAIQDWFASQAGHNA